MFILIELRFNPVWDLRISALVVIIYLFVFKGLIASMPRVLSWNITKEILFAFWRGVRWTSYSNFDIVNLILLIALSLEFPVIFRRALLSLLLAHKHNL